MYKPAYTDNKTSSRNGVGTHFNVYIFTRYVHVIPYACTGSYISCQMLY